MCLSAAFIAAGPVCLLVMLPGLRTAQGLRTQGSSGTRVNFSRMCTHPITPVVAAATLASTRAPGLQKLPTYLQNETQKGCGSAGKVIGILPSTFGSRRRQAI